MTPVGFKKYILPISPSYVAHWGLWEAVREIYQNALDAELEPDCRASIDYSEQTAVLTISTTKGKLSASSLVLGNTTKGDDPRQRGKFGEGYKLALLVLARRGNGVRVFTGGQRWTATIETEPHFESKVLVITVEHGSGEPAMDGVYFQIDWVTPSNWVEIRRNILSPQPNHSRILDTKEQVGRIYVGGLYVSTVKGFQCGYAFRPGVIKLDRDRGMVDGFDLAWETSKLWTETNSGSRVINLIESKAPDVQYVENHVDRASPFSLRYHEHFVQRYGEDAFPVTNQEEIEKAQRAGVKWVLIPEGAMGILRKVKSWFLSSTLSPLEQLVAFRTKYDWNMNDAMKQELDGIIDQFAPKKVS